MERPGKIARIIIAALTLAGLMNWNTTEQRAATSGTLTGPGDQSCSGSACNGKIAFVSASENENGKKTHTIYKMNPDGSDRMQLTSGPADFAPAWSPDGAQIVFVRNSASSEQSEIYIMNAEGSDQRGLTSGESDHSPAWSPDGKQIVFVRLIQEGGSRLATPAQERRGTGYLFLSTAQFSFLPL